MGLRDFLRRAFASGDPDDGSPAEGHPGGGAARPSPALGAPSGMDDARVVESRSGQADDSDDVAEAGRVSGAGHVADSLHVGEAVRGSAPYAGDRRPLDDDALRDALRLRLVSLDSLPTVEGLPHVRAIAPGVVEVLTIDLPDRIVVPPAVEVLRLGEPKELVALGKEHLRRLIGPGLHRREIRAEDGLRFCFAHGQGSSTSSLAVVLPAVMNCLEGGFDGRRGVAVAVPDAQHLAYRIIDGLESIMALGPMATFARNGYDEGGGSISPEVYWARGPRLDQWEQLTRQSPDGIEIHVPAALTALVEED